MRNVCGYLEIADGRLYATVDELKRLKELGERQQISLDCIAPPFLESSYRPREASRHHVVAEPRARPRYRVAPDADPQPCVRGDSVHQLQHEYSRRAANVTDVATQTTAPGVLKKQKPSSPLTRAGRVDADPTWERITYFWNI